jgi:hypothetical protein
VPRECLVVSSLARGQGAAVGWFVALVVLLAVIGLVAWGASRTQRRVSEDPGGARRAAADAEGKKWIAPGGN